MEGSSSPAAEGLRVGWQDVPERIRALVEGWLGSPVVSATNQPAGFSPGAAARLRTASGWRVFAKAAGPEPNELTPTAHRREAKVAAALPDEAPVPRLQCGIVCTPLLKLMFGLCASLVALALPFV